MEIEYFLHDKILELYRLEIYFRFSQLILNRV